MAVVEALLSAGLRMRGRDVAAVNKVHAAANAFEAVMGEVQGGSLLPSFSPSSSSSSSSSSSLAEAGAGVLDAGAWRLRLGLIVRAAGPWYQHGLHLAAANQILLALLPSRGQGQGQGLGELLDVLAGACGLEPAPAPSPSSPSSSSCAGGGRGAGPDPLSVLLSCVSPPSRDRALAALQSAEAVAAALAALELDGAWATPLLLNGEGVKAVFKNIPKGPAFGQVRRSFFLL